VVAVAVRAGAIDVFGVDARADVLRTRLRSASPAEPSASRMNRLSAIGLPSPVSA
jgi:hypothetical protein